MIARSVAELAAALERREISSVELTRLYLDRIARLDPKLNAFISVDEEKSLAQARGADDLLAAGQAGPLTGIPLAQKDIFCAKGWLTTCGSKMLGNFVSPYDATVIERCNAARSTPEAPSRTDDMTDAWPDGFAYYPDALTEAMLQEAQVRYALLPYVAE